MIKMTLNLIRAKTTQWFNETFGTALEDVPEGDTGNSHSCVLANALQQNVNTNIKWMVGNEHITVEYTKYINNIHCTYNNRYYHIPVTLGNECMSIEDKRWKSAPQEYEDYGVTLHQDDAIELPDYVRTFINAFDWQMYPDLKSDGNKYIDWYEENSPTKMPGYDNEYNDHGIFIIDKPEPEYHNPIFCPRKEDYKQYPLHSSGEGWGDGYCMYCLEDVAV